MIGKNDIIKQLAERIYGNTSQKSIQESTQFCDTLVDIIVDGLLNNEKILWKGFLSMDITNRSERKGRHPQTNEIVVFPSVKSVNCKIRDSWMLPVVDNGVQYSNIQVIQIDENEYNTLLEAIESGEEIEIPQEEPQVEQSEQTTDNIYNATLEFIKENKTKEMSNVCNQTITNGFDIVLSDNETHHFSLTIQDQLNLITLSSLVSAGQTEIPYHADGELCKYYSNSDILQIIAKATEFKTYHVTYYNSLKVYIESIDNIEDVSRIEYGVNIPVEYQSEILKGIIENA